MTPPKEAFAEVARRVIEAHGDDWDAPHQFVTLHWDGENLTPGTVAVIDPAIDPADYEEHMDAIARQQIGRDADAPYAYLLQIEAFSVTPREDWNEAEKQRFAADRLGHTFHQRPDATEQAIAYVADIHGRLWSAPRRRGDDGISEGFYPPGPRQPGGRLIAALTGIAHATGMAFHGLPGPQNLQN